MKFKQAVKQSDGIPPKEFEKIVVENKEELESFDIKDFINTDDKWLILIRGVPGSGKSSLASKIKSSIGGEFFEADQFLMVNGEYKWEASKLHMAHDRCNRAVENAMRNKVTPIIVSNTSLVRRDYKEHIQFAIAHDYKIFMISLKTEFGSIHDVPEETMSRMRNKFKP